MRIILIAILFVGCSPGQIATVALLSSATQKDTVVVKTSSLDQEKSNEQGEAPARKGIIKVPESAGIVWVTSLNSAPSGNGYNNPGDHCVTSRVWEIAGFDTVKNMYLMREAQQGWGSGCSMGTLFWMRPGVVDSIEIYDTIERIKLQEAKDAINRALGVERP